MSPAEGGTTIHVQSHPGLKLGLKPPSAPRLLHFDTIKRMAGIDTSSPQPFDYTAGLPDDTGVMYNDTFGCCTAAAKYHRLQIVVYRLTGVFLLGSALQDLALDFYSKTTGFDPTKTLPDGSNPTDQGGDIQAIAEYLVNTGMMLPGGKVDQFAAAFLVDPTNMQDMLYCGRECMGMDLGVSIKTAVMPEDGSSPPKVWGDGGDLLGYHDIFAPGGGLPNGQWKVDSWGKWYYPGPSFMENDVNQAIAYVSADALKDGKTLLGLDIGQWQNALTDHYSQVAMLGQSSTGFA